MTAVTGRNLRLFFRDKSAVFFALLTSLIIIGLYVLFLGDMWVETFQDFTGVREFMDNWVMAGLTAISSVTAGFSAFGTMIGDRSRGIVKDLYAAPVRRRSLAGGYVLSAFLIGYILSLFTLFLAEAYIVARGGAFMNGQALLRVLAILFLSDLSNTAMVFFITSLISGENAFSAVGTVVGTLIGFLTGIYIPIGSLPEPVRWAVRLFPPSHGACLLRREMMEPSLARSFENVPSAYYRQVRQILGVDFSFGGEILPEWGSVLILAGSGALFFLLAVWRLSRRKRA